MEGRGVPIGILWAMLVILGLAGFWCIYLERDLNTATFGISRFEAAKLKEYCEKSLPRDEKCVPKLAYEVK